MTLRSDRPAFGRPSRRFTALFMLGFLLLGARTAAAAGSELASGKVDDSGDIANPPRSLTLPKPALLSQTSGTPEPLSAADCAVTVVQTDGGTSISQRAPNSNALFGRAVYLVTAAEAAATGLTAGTVPSAIGWRYSTPPGVVANGTLIVYLQNTTDTTNLKSTTWATAIAGMTVVHNSASTSLPNTTVPFDIPFTGGSAFTYTGGGLYVAFDWHWAGPATTSSAAVFCNTELAGGLKGAQSNTSAPTTTIASDFRPETRLTPSSAPSSNDASVDFVMAPGSLPKTLVGPQSFQAVVTNRGTMPLNNLPVTLNITGVETFSDTQIVPSIATACNGQTSVTFQPFTPATLGSDTLTASVPADDVSSNNSKTRPLNETNNLYSYKYPGTTASGGVGFTGSTGAFVAEFTLAQSAKISAVNLEFFATSATTYKVAVYPDAGGQPGLIPLYVDASNRTVAASGPVTVTLPTPLAVGPGTFYVGIQQTNATNAAMSFDNESPLRRGTFFMAVPNPPASWFDFQPDNNYKLNIGITLIQCATGADCNDGNACTDDTCTNQLCVHTNNSATECDNNPCSAGDRCLNGHCKPGPNPCDDANNCTIDVCDGQGGCSYTAVNCNDNNVCTDDFCVSATGCGHTDNNAPCADGNACTLGDACGGGVCLPGTVPLPAPVQFCNAAVITIPDAVAPAASSPYPSAITVANTASYLCGVTVNLNGITHTIPDDIDILLSHLSATPAIIMSDVGASAAASGVNLTLSDAAAGPIPGTLVSGTYKPTNLDGAGTGTESWPAPAPAPPAAPGAAFSTFIGTNPNGVWNLWVVDDFAQGLGSIGGWCVNVVAVCSVAADCNDSNVCTTDACVNSQCTHTNNFVCDDGNPCTQNTCNPSTGQCQYPALVCNDSNACTDDSCAPGSGCVFTNDNTNACSDGNLCTQSDVCQSGTCVGQNPVVCTADANICTTEACNPATGGCISTNNTVACDDGNGCTLGDACGPRFAQNFDALAVPALPSGWTTAVTGVGNLWTTVNTTSDTVPNAVFGYDGGQIADTNLTSPTINIVTTTAKVTFRNRWAFETSITPYDGGVFEISIGGGAFTDILAAGGSFASGGYTGTLSVDFGNPIGGRSAWAMSSAGYPAYLTTTVNLPAAAAGQAVKLRWRIGTDDSNGAAGQNIDSIVVQDGATNTCMPGVPITAPPETTGLTASNKTTYNWAAASGATRYDVLRGGTAAFPVGPGGSDETCFNNLSGATVTDAQTPSPGTGYWYLSRAENTCGSGTYGNRSNGTPRTTTTCP